MNTFLPTTTVSVYRGESTDDYGDPAPDNTTPAATGVPASVLESSQRKFDPASQRLTLIEQYTVRIRGHVSMREQDRIRDEVTGQWYLAKEISRPQNFLGRKTDNRITATRVGNLSP